MCAGGFSRYAKGNIFFKSGDIEKIDEEGKIVPDLEKCKKILLERKLNYMADEIF